LGTPPQPEAAPGAATALDADLACLGSRAPLARMLLVALSWAQGPGLPWEGIWPVLALALAAHGGPGEQRLTRRDLRWLIGAAGSHVVTDTGPGGMRVYRMRHAQAAAHLRGEPPADEAGSAAAWQQHRATTEATIATALLATVPSGTHGRDWARAHPYLRAYLGRHAAAAGPGPFAELIADPGFLAAADPRLLVPLMSLACPGGRDIVCGYRRAFPLLDEDPHANAAHLQEAARAQGRPAPDTRAGTRPQYRTVMASVRRDDSLLTLRGHTAMVYSVAFGTGPGGRLVLASGGDDGTIRLWDPLTGTPAGEPITGHGDRTAGPGFAPWGQTMKPSETYWNTGVEVERVVFGTAQNGQFLLASAGCDRTVRVWDPLTGAPVGDVLTGHTGRLWCLAAAHAPDGRLLLASGGDDMTVRIWDPVAGSLVCGPLTGHTDQVVMTAMATVDGNLLLATASSDGTVRLWDPLTGTSLAEPLTGHDGPAFAVVFGTAPDGRLLLVSAGEDATVRLWDPLTGAPVGGAMTGHTDRVDGLAFGTTPDGRWLLASSSRDQTIRLWDPLAGIPVGEPLIGHTSWVFELASGTAADGRVLLASASADTTIKIWDPFSGETPGEPVTGHSRWVTSVGFGTAPDGRLLLAAGSGDGGARVWDPRTGGPGWPVPDGPPDVPAVALGTAPDGRLLLAAGGDDAVIRVWDAHTRVPLGQPAAGHRGMVRAVAFGLSPTGRLLLASGGTDRTARLWDPLTGEPIGEPLSGHDGWVDTLAFGTAARLGLLLATGGDDGTVRIWDALTGRPAGQPLTGHRGGIRALAAANGRHGRLLLATGGEDGTIRIWDALTGRPAGKPLTGHTQWIAALAFAVTPAGRLLLVSASGDRTVRLWHPASGACLMCLRRGSALRTVAAAGLVLALGDDNGVSVIELAEEDLPPVRAYRAAWRAGSTWRAIRSGLAGHGSR
jgi:WD40 repeat protein